MRKIESHLLFLSSINNLTLGRVLKQGVDEYFNRTGNKNVWDSWGKNLNPKKTFVEPMRLDGAKLENEAPFLSLTGLCYSL